MQTADSVEHEDSLRDWLTTSTTTTTATQTSAPEALQQWRTTQGKYWLELHRLWRRIQRTLDQIRDPILEQLRDRIQAIALDMSALNQSCNVDSNTPRAPQGLPDQRSAVVLPCRYSKRRHSARRRSGVAGLRDERGDLTNGHAASSTIEESSSSADRVNSQRKRARCCKEPTPPSSLMHIQTATSLHLHIATFRSHDSSFHSTVHYEWATFHCSVTHSHWLTTDVKHKFGQLSLARVLLNTPRDAGIRIGETHDGDWTAAEQSNATHRRINEAGDSVPSSQDSVTRAV